MLRYVYDISVIFNIGFEIFKIIFILTNARNTYQLINYQLIDYKL